jgi:hypothetical protein
MLRRSIAKDKRGAITHEPSKELMQSGKKYWK